MQWMTFTVAGIALAVSLAALGDGDPGFDLPRPTPEQADWLDMELEMFVCLDPCTWQDRDYDDHSTPLSAINPELLDTDQWCEVAKSWGAGQILFVAKHTGGFCWWQTDTSDYSIKNTPWRDGKGDVLADLSESCRKYGLKLAVYVYPGDDTWGAYIGGGGRTTDPAKQEGYNEVLRQQLTEVWTRYGEVNELWFDGSCVIEIGDLVEKYAPNALILQSPHANLRWVGNEAGYAPYPAWNTVKREDGESGVSTAAHGDPDGDMFMPLEVDTVNVHPHWWFWKSQGRTLKTVDELMQHYYDSVGRGAVLLLNSTPDTTGRIPTEDVAQYAAFGDEIKRRFGQSIAETQGEGSIVELDLGGPTAVNHVITMERIREGERIREYVLEGLVGDSWLELASGTSVGHKRIDLFPTCEVEKIRLRVTDQAATPLIRRLAAFNVPGAFPEPIAESAWGFDEGSGTSTTSQDGSQAGEITGAAWVEGRDGGALEFDGQTGHVSLGDADFGASDFALAAWIKPRSTAANTGTIISKERNSLASGNLRLYLTEGDRLGFWITDTEQRGALWPFETEPGAVPMNEWSHVAVTRRGVEVTLCINGEKRGEKLSDILVNHSNKLDLRIGGRYPPGGGDESDYVFDGAIDDVRIYTRALSPEELASPDDLPEPGGYRRVLRWSDGDASRGSTWDIDLTAFIRIAGVYEVVFRPEASADEMPIADAVLVLEGVETPGCTEPADETRAYRVTRTAAPTGGRDQTILRVRLRAGATLPRGGEVLIRPVR